MRQKTKQRGALIPYKTYRSERLQLRKLSRTKPPFKMNKFTAKRALLIPFDAGLHPQAAPGMKPNNDTLTPAAGGCV